MCVSMALAVRAKPRGSRTAPGIELKVWRRTEQGLQVEEEESVVF